MRRSTSVLSRLFVPLLAAALITAPIHVARAAPSVEELYTQGQEKFDAGEYGPAADNWAQAARSLEENEDNSATRQTIMNLALDAYLRAYRADSDRSNIDKAKALLDEYEASLANTGTELTTEIASEKAKIESILEELAAAEVPDEPEEKPDVKPDEPKPVGPPPKPGQGLVIGGAVMLGVGAGGLGLMIGGMVGGAAAQKDFDAQPAGAEREAARTRGKTMNILAITGGIAGGLLIGAGVALLVIGLNKNKHARIQHHMSVLPTAGPNSAGLALTGRF